MLTQYLAAYQAQLDASDGDFAARLGLEPETWTGLRIGKEQYSPALLARILTRFPNAISVALEDLRRPAEPVAAPRGAESAVAIAAAGPGAVTERQLTGVFPPRVVAPPSTVYA